MADDSDSGAPAPREGSGDGGAVAPSADLLKLEEFIFVRELYEVFLLLDHISGRWDKVLRSNGAQSPSIIETVCGIGLAPAADPQARLQQAVDLMSAKDTLNAIARPATGLTVAFTILVVGEENRRKPLGKLRRVCRDLFYDNTQPREDDAAPRRGSGGVMWDKPTRVTLARYAYPGLIGVAIKFNRRMSLLVAFLLCALAFTCVLSWHVSAGNVILQHLEDVRARTVEVRKEISAAELKFAADERERAAPRGLPTPVVQFCTLGTEQRPAYRTTEEYQLCQRERDLREERRAVRLNLRDWLAPWKTAYRVLMTATYHVDRWLTPPGAATPAMAPPPDSVRRRGHEEKARIVTLVVGTAVLPLAYGVLGAGAAVVRRLWERMRESTLSPRDSTLALLQLALGGTIGACIALFINPSGPAPAEERGLLGAWALSGSALSFIAGFGVEGVFRALEGFVHRVFGVHEPQAGTEESRGGRDNRRSPW
ncbi:hypothetical protein [Pseudoduganella chitinolytica]|uniref:Uncharacterized protein n=1 Tax=Pseudoduganella chitinolytica TaxID=34070 RepID=A0ABY8BG14_9BURK|nr:hypothetical protein [Pseudoduganella chitinolytica]WEF34844.1 hypothetical protein PX653_08805 [Pseudoduganella chitinolytica]